MRKQGRNQKGQGLVEVSVVSAAFMVPCLLVMMDMFFLFAANSINDQFVKVAARAAASQSTEAGARKAAEVAISKFPVSLLIPNIEIVKVVYDEANEAGKQKVVIVQTRMTTQMPVTFPFIPNKPQFTAASMEPITALPPNAHGDT